MIEILDLSPRVRLCCVRERRLKQSCLSVQFVQPMSAPDAPRNAMLPAVLLRGCRDYPDLRAISARLDTLWGALVSPMVRRVCDTQTTGFYSAFLRDRFVPEGERLLDNMAQLLRALLREPCMDGGVFPADTVRTERANLVSAIDDARSDKRAYAVSELLRRMCRADSYGIPRLGTREEALAITPEALTAHYARVLERGGAVVIYVGDCEPERLAQSLEPLFAGLPRTRCPLPEPTRFRDAPAGVYTQRLPVAQARLCLGFTSDITVRDDDYAAMLLFARIFGGGQTSRLFTALRERRALCYDVGADYYSAKGLLVVSAGVDASALADARGAVLTELDALQSDGVTERELADAQRTLCAALRSIPDSPASMEHFCLNGLLNGTPLSPAERCDAVAAVTCEDILRAARAVRLHSEFTLRGDET